MVSSAATSNRPPATGFDRVEFSRVAAPESTTSRSRMVPEHPVILSFDVEEHDRIEAAASLPFQPETRAKYAERMEITTRKLLELLAAERVSATFYIVGEIARSHPRLVRDIADTGHEVGSHGWDHRRVHRFSPTGFAEDLRTSVDALEQAAGVAVAGYRAPTFSVMQETAWAADVLADSGLRYDSSIFPVRHDRYGVPDAPRTPFRLEGTAGGSILELPPATLRVARQNLPVAGGGYFRLFPLEILEAGIRQLSRIPDGLAMLYFHPWEFDPDQPRLPLGKLARWRTYVGIGRTESRLRRLIAGHQGRFCRAIDVLERLEMHPERLPRFRLAP